MRATVRELFRTQLDFLLFRSISPNLKHNFWSYFAFVLIITWLVGIGRYWDHPSAEPWQYAGLGSVAYIFVLSALLYLIIWPLRSEHWRFSTVLIFVGLTSLPAILYAIPVERFFSLKAAQSINAWFLAAVAVWRVALYVRFLVTSARLQWFEVVVVTILPLTGIVAALAALNLEHVVFNVMGGIRDSDASPYDAAYSIVILLTVFAFFAFPVAAIAYLFIVANRWHRRRSTP